MNEAISVVDNMVDTFSLYTLNNSSIGAVVSPFFSMRKLRMVYNELSGNNEFEFASFDDFKQSVLSSPIPQLELSKWQAIASRR